MTPTRWASAPPDDHPLRQELLSWTKAERDAVYAYVGRQYVPDIQRWIALRATQYRQAFPNEKELRLWHEAAADLVAWQRRIKAKQVLPWLMEWEATVAEQRQAQP